MNLEESLKNLADSLSQKQFDTLDVNKARLDIFSAIQKIQDQKFTIDRLRDENNRLHLDVAFYSNSVILHNKKS